MTALLQQVIAKVEALPEAQQDAFASEWLDELESERKWDDLFIGTTDDQWQGMMDMVKADIAAGKVHTMEALDEIAPD
ncbi:MAG: hypothetical protein JWO08_2577 [Verrucomicrobiaceae bacterium]|nr:hypothetical protein [Verrucomicrobiaceae bacterium]